MEPDLIVQQQTPAVIGSWDGGASYLLPRAWGRGGNKFKPMRPIRFAELFDGRLRARGLYECIVPGITGEGHRCLTDGDTLVWVFSGLDGEVKVMLQYREFLSSNVIDAIRDIFGAEIVSDRDARFWGFPDAGEWEAFCSEEHRHQDAEFRTDFLSFVASGECQYDAGSEELELLKIGRDIVGENLEMVKQERWNLLKQIVEYYRYGDPYLDWRDMVKNVNSLPTVTPISLPIMPPLS